MFCGVYGRVKQRKHERCKKIVLETSSRLRKLSEVNARYNFNSDIKSSYAFAISLSSKSKFDRYDLDALLNDSILQNTSLLQVQREVERNKELYAEYQKEVDSLQSEVTRDLARGLGVKYEVYVGIESAIFGGRKLEPVVECSVVCTKTYDSPQGYRHYEESASYPIDMVPGRYSELKAKIAYQNSEEARKKRARSQMTDKLRYEILKRDGFRCKLCGRTADDGVKLHVDHIVPVAKGGETVPDNLRTLCEDCNWGKGDRLEDS